MYGTRSSDHHHIYELHAFERDLLDWYAEERYDLYRRKGMSIKAAYRAALAWQRNMAEQKARRLSHDTGAAGVIR